MRRHGWLELEVRHFAALDAVAREGSFRRAADRLGYVQSAVSQQIAFLERVAAARLVERSPGPRPVTLTAAGRLMLERARIVLQQLGEAREDLGELETLQRRTVRLGIAAAPLTGVLATLVAAVAEACPELVLDAHEVDCDQRLVDALSAGELDLALAELPPLSSRLAALTLAIEPYRLLGTRAQLQTSAGAARIGGRALIAPPPARSLQRVHAWLLERGETPRIAYRSADAATIAAWASAGLGLALVPSGAPSREWPGLEELDLGEPLPTRTLGLVYSDARPPSSAAALVLRAAGAAVRAGSDQHRDGRQASRHARPPAHVARAPVRARLGAGSG